MSEINSANSTRPAAFDWLSAWQQLYGMNQPTWNNYWTGLLSSDVVGWWWGQYARNWTQTQALFQQYNEKLLEISGLPTRDDLSRVNRQLYDLANRLDELEDRLATPRNGTGSSDQLPS